MAIADGERGGEVRYLGEVASSEESMRRLVKRIAAKHDRVHFCYEAGPTGYGLYRLITSLGHPCVVVAPSLIPRKPGDRVKTNRRDAVALAKLLRAGELTPVWVPDEGHEAIRDLVRARAAAVETLRVHRQQVSAFMLKHGRIFPRKTAWGARHLRWLQEQGFDHPAHQIALQEMVEAARTSKERVERLEATIEEFVPTWSLAPIVQALQALRGVGLIVAVTFATEIGDMRRFDSPRQLMGYLGLVPSELCRALIPGLIRRGGSGGWHQITPNNLAISSSFGAPGGIRTRDHPVNSRSIRHLHHGHAYGIGGEWSSSVFTALLPCASPKEVTELITTAKEGRWGTGDHGSPAIRCASFPREEDRTRVTLAFREASSTARIGAGSMSERRIRHLHHQRMGFQGNGRRPVGQRPSGAAK